MSDALEKSLREALQAEQPPSGFAERVLARVNAENKGRTLPQRRQPERGSIAQWLEGFRAALAFNQRGWALALAGIVVAAVALGWYQQHNAREKARLIAQEQAREKALYALRLTGEKLAPAQRALAELGISLPVEVPREARKMDTAQ